MERAAAADPTTRHAGAASEFLFGELARALRPRALAPGADGRLRLALRDGALSGEARALLAALPGARLAAAAGPYGEALLELGLEELERAAGRSAEAALLVSTARAAARPHPAQPVWMGIVNVTPDSFSDGGRFLDPGRAVEHGLRLEAEGAAILDVGGESTRPGAEPVPVEVELERVLPVVAGLAARSGARISIDTSKAAVARAAVERGATIVNDVTAGRADPRLVPTVAELGCELVLMHSRGSPRDMQRDPRYADAVAEVADALREAVARCLKAGVELQRMVLDPGIGFAKRLEHNLDLLRRLSELRSLGLPLCLGVSRKSFIAHATDAAGPAGRAGTPPAAAGGGTDDRSGGTAAAVAWCALAGAEILRVHDVARMRQSAAVALAIAGRSALPPGVGTPLDANSAPPRSEPSDPAHNRPATGPDARP